MKLKILRMSNDPVSPEARAAYDSDWKSFYDKADERARTKHSAGAYTDEYALIMRRYLSFGERLLMQKHGAQVEEVLPTTKKAWTALISKYEDAPISLARTADGKDLILLIMDTLGG